MSQPAIIDLDHRLAFALHYAFSAHPEAVTLRL